MTQKNKKPKGVRDSDFQHYESDSATVTTIKGETGKQLSEKWKNKGDTVTINISDPRLEEKYGGSVKINLYDWNRLSITTPDGTEKNIYFKSKWEGSFGGLKIFVMDDKDEDVKEVLDDLIKGMEESHKKIGIPFRIGITTKESVILTTLEGHKAKSGVYPGHEKYF